MSSFTRALRRKPAVSTNINSWPKAEYLASIESRVVPAISVTMLRSSPSNRLTNDDLPTLGRPMMAMRGSSELGSSSPASSKWLTTASSNSPVPEPLAELMANTSVSPRPRA
uniref:Uncharacterized protein n=1 Tax=Tanacetum cinerariifolium TaxID=118510 RepID=A0A699WM48_TANCI|nr:hypothetical protein [Tanacetum cinerariifolium]